MRPVSLLADTVEQRLHRRHSRHDILSICPRADLRSFVEFRLFCQLFPTLKTLTTLTTIVGQGVFTGLVAGQTPRRPPEEISKVFQ